MIELEGVTKRYTKDSHVVQALADISLVIDRGEFVAVVGPSGSGKSTLLHIVGLLDRPDEGMYRLDGRDVERIDADALAAIRNRELGFVFQAFHLLPKTPAIENVELPLIYSDRPDIDGLARRALERVGLADRATHLPSELSGGQQQRVAIARALVNEPKVILADEPTGNLDSASGLEIVSILQDLNEQGTTIILVTHDLALSSMARRRIELVDGRIVRDQPIAQRRDARSALVELAKGTKPLALAPMLLIGLACMGIACRASPEPVRLGYQLADQASYVVSLEQKMAVRMGEHATDGSRVLRAGYSIRATEAPVGADPSAIVHLDSVRVDLVMGQSRHLIDTRHLPGREFALRMPAAGGPPQYEGDEVPTVELGERGGGSVPTSLFVEYAFPTLPDEPVSVGSTWTEHKTRRQLEASVWVTAEVTTTHTVVGYDTVEGKRCLVIESESSGATRDGSAHGSTFAYAGNVRGSARWCFDAAGGALLSMSGEEVTSGLVNPAERSASIDQTSTVTIRHLPAEVTSPRDGR